MASISELPVETLNSVTDYLDTVGDLSAFARSGNRYVHHVVTTTLYSRVKDEIGIMCWAFDEGRLGTVKRLLAAGADPNALWEQKGKQVSACEIPSIHLLGTQRTCQLPSQAWRNLSLW